MGAMLEISRQMGQKSWARPIFRAKKGKRPDWPNTLVLSPCAPLSHFPRDYQRGRNSHPPFTHGFREGRLSTHS